MTDAKKVTEAECAYLAGLIDQCGHVRIQREKRKTGTYRTLLLKLQGLSASGAAWLLQKFGPGISVTRPSGNEITFITRRAAVVCVHAYPYLLDMKESARLVTRFAASLGSKRVPMAPENVAIREEVDKQLAAIERRGGRR